MTHEDYEKLLTEVVAGGENAGETAKQILSNIDDDAKSAQDALDTAKAQYDELTGKYEDINKQLKEANVKIFMNTTGSSEEEKDPGEILQEEADNILKSVINPPQESEE